MSEHLLVAQKHFQAFCKFENFQRQKSTAKDKLTKLSQHQFQELSTDVYDELMRREEDQEDFLAPVPSYHPKRNQARQKLCTLQRSRFDELVSDVYHEICTRYPSVTRRPSLSKLVIPIPPPNSSSSQPPAATQGQSLNQSQGFNSIGGSMNNLASGSKKGTLEKNNVDLPAVNFASLDNLMADLGGLMSENDFTDPKSPTEKEELVTELQNTIENMKLRLKEKDDQVQVLLQDAKKQKVESESQFRNISNELTKVKSEYVKLQKDFDAEKARQADLKTEAANLLSEIKTLSVENASLRGSKEKSNTQINQLFDQITELKQKEKILQKENEELRSRTSLPPGYTNGTTNGNTIGNINGTTHGNTNAEAKFIPTSIKVTRTNPNIDFQKDQLDNNMFKERLEEYYIAVNTLLAETRSQEEPSASILIAMKSVVLACKSLTSSCEDYEQKVGNTTSLASLKSQMSTSLTNQMVACKQAALTPTSPVKFNIEKELLSLTTVVLELARQCQELDKSKTPSLKSPPTSKVDRDGPSLYELKHFLESQTDQIVKSIQALLSLLRQSKYSSQEFMTTINSISSIVTSLVDASQTPLKKAQIDCDTVINSLIKSRDGLVDLAGKVVKEPGSKGLKQQIASSSCEIAKQVKTLIGLIE